MAGASVLMLRPQRIPPDVQPAGTASSHGPGAGMRADGEAPAGDGGDTYPDAVAAAVSADVVPAPVKLPVLVPVVADVTQDADAAAAAVANGVAAMSLSSPSATAGAGAGAGASAPEAEERADSAFFTKVVDANGSLSTINRESVTKSLYVSELDPSVTEEHLQALFSLGAAPDTCIASVKIVRDRSTRESLGYGYINYSVPGMAGAALKALNGHVLAGRAIRVVFSREKGTERSRRNNDANLYVKNLEYHVTTDQLLAAFRKFGTIASCRVMEYPDGNSKGFGFVAFQERTDALLALRKMDGYVINGKAISVSMAQTREERARELALRYGPNTTPPSSSGIGPGSAGSGATTYPPLLPIPSPSGLFVPMPMPPPGSVYYQAYPGSNAGSPLMVMLPPRAGDEAGSGDGSGASSPQMQAYSYVPYMLPPMPYPQHGYPGQPHQHQHQHQQQHYVQQQQQQQQQQQRASGTATSHKP